MQAWRPAARRATIPDPRASSAAIVLCKRLTGQLVHHNLKEERVLYPRADHVLPPEAARRLQAFLGSGALPEGWVCLRARPAPSDAGR